MSDGCCPGHVNVAALETRQRRVSTWVLVITAALSVWVFASGWPDVLVAIALLALFLRSAIRVLRGAWQEMYPAHSLT